MSTTRLDSGSITASELGSASFELLAAGENRRHSRGEQQAAAEREQDPAAPPLAQGGHRAWARRGLEGRILVEDRLLELLELGAGLEPELLVEGAAGIPVTLEGLGLAAGTVEGEHQLTAQPLACRMLCDQDVELTDQGAMAAERQVGLDSVFERVQAQLLEPADLVLGEGLVGEVRQRRPTPETQRLPQGLRGAAVITALDCLAPRSGEALKPIGIDLVGVGLERVAPATGDEHALAELLAQVGDVDLHGLGRGLGRALAPELVDDPVDRDDLAPMKQQDREHRALPGSAKGNRSPIDQNLERTEDAEFHPGTSVPAELTTA